MSVETVRRRLPDVPDVPDVPDLPDLPDPPVARRPLAPPQEPHRLLADQQAFATDAAGVLRRAGTSGQRLTTALFLILAEHAATPVAGEPGTLHLRCTRCRTEDLEPAAQYPCTTAQQAYWALDAVLG